MIKNIFSLIIVFSVVTIGAIFSCSDKNEKKSDENKQASANTRIDHGRYLVTIMGCNDCHTPLKMGPTGPEPDMDRFLSGHPSNFPMPAVDTNALKNWVLFTYTNTAIAGPWGISFTANITSDSTGIGTWKFAQFKKALTEGKYLGLDSTRPLLPPMPWQNYKNIKDKDLKDMFAFLQSTKPIHNVVPQAIFASH